MKNALLTSLWAVAAASLVEAQEIPGWPGLDEEALDELIDEAIEHVGANPNLACVRLDRRKPKYPAITSCAPQNLDAPDCPGQFLTFLFPNRMAEDYGVPESQRSDYGWMTGDFAGSVLSTLMHELMHACLSADGLACPQNRQQTLCVELLIDVHLAKKICDATLGYCQIACAAFGNGAFADGRKYAKWAKGLCKVHALMRSTWNRPEIARLW